MLPHAVKRKRIYFVQNFAIIKIWIFKVNFQAVIIKIFKEHFWVNRNLTFKKNIFPGFFFVSFVLVCFPRQTRRLVECKIMSCLWASNLENGHVFILLSFCYTFAHEILWKSFTEKEKKNMKIKSEWKTSTGRMAPYIWHPASCKEI